MAKSQRSKIKRRYLRAKRHQIERTSYKDSINALHQNVVNIQLGLHSDNIRLKNAFLYPDDHEAVFPQKTLPTVVDFRSEALPTSGYCVSGGRRAFTDAEKLALDLVVGSQDGLLLSEKNKMLDLQEMQLRTYQQQQQQQREPDVNMMNSDGRDGTVSAMVAAPAVTASASAAAAAAGVAVANRDNEEVVLIESMLESFNLKSNATLPHSSAQKQDELQSNKNEATSAADLENMKKHQQKIGGLAKKEVHVPAVVNKLKSQKKPKIKWRDP